MTRVPLTVKIGLVILAVLIIGFGASTVLTIQQESALLVDQSKQAARRLTEALIASVESAMLQERPDVTRMLISDLKSSSAVPGLDIYRRNGVEAFTDLATLQEVEKNAGLEKAVFDSISKMARPAGPAMTGPLFARAVETLQTQESLEQRDGATFFTVHRPVLNQEKCQGCHGTDHKVRAVVRVATSMEPVFAEVRAQRNRQMLVGLFTIVAAGGVLWVAMRQVVVQPIRQVAGVARRIGGGRFRRARHHQGLPRRDRRPRRGHQRDERGAGARAGRAVHAQRGAGQHAGEPPGFAPPGGAAPAAQGGALEVRA